MTQKKFWITFGFLLAIIITFLWLFPALKTSAQPSASVFTDINAGLEGGNYASAAWGDYDKDGDLDVLVSGAADSGYITKVYRNDAGVFVEANAGLMGAWQGSVDWGDYDNDNDLDILLTGEGPIGKITKIYRNDQGVFTDTTISLPGVSQGAAKWGDYDQDGDLDIVLAGEATYSTVTIYRNNQGVFSEMVNTYYMWGTYQSSAAWGDYDNDEDMDLAVSGTGSWIYKNANGVFMDMNANLGQVFYGSVDWGDCDSDGDLDLLFNSSNYGYPPNLMVLEYANNGFTPHYLAPNGTQYGNATWGDYDNDGDLDIVILGDPTTFKVYQNNGSFDFTDISAGLPYIHNGATAWGDYNNDGRLDILASGETSLYARVTKIFQSHSVITNTVPTAPVGLIASTGPYTATLSWDPATDLQTPQNGLTYNLRIGTVPGGTDILSPMADLSTGYRHIPRQGNGGLGTRYTIHGLTPGATYYWSVQAVDTAFAGSGFSSEGSFTTPKIYFAYLPLVENLFPVYIPPGHYPVNRCVNSDLYIQSTYVGILTECVPSVLIGPNGYMQFNFTWSLDYTSPMTPIIKYSDAYNYNMFIRDNLGNRYNHTEVGGAAAQDTRMYDNTPIEGWFLFIPAKQNATTFAFYDNDQAAVINNIVLAP